MADLKTLPPGGVGVRVTQRCCVQNTWPNLSTAPSFPHDGAPGSVRSPSESKGTLSTHILGEQRSARWSLGGGSPSSGGYRVPRCCCVVPVTMASSPRVALAPLYPLPCTALPWETASGRHRAGQAARLTRAPDGFATGVSLVCVNNPASGH